MFPDVVTHNIVQLEGVKVLGGTQDQVLNILLTLSTYSANEYFSL